jgi:hypothetical protein
MAKITSIEVGIGVTFQPRERESVSMDLAIRADIKQDDSVEATVAHLHRNARFLVDRNIAPFLQATKRLKGNHTHLIVEGEPGLDLGRPNDEDNWDVPAIPQPEIKSMSVRWGQTWEVRSWEFLKSDLKFYVELEDGDDPAQVAQTHTDQIKYLVRANAKPVLENFGYLKKKQFVPKLNTSDLETGKTQLPTPEIVQVSGVQPSDIESDAGIALSI